MLPGLCQSRRSATIRSGLLGAAKTLQKCLRAEHCGSGHRLRTPFFGSESISCGAGHACAVEPSYSRCGEEPRRTAVPKAGAGSSGLNWTVTDRGRSGLRSEWGLSSIHFAGGSPFFRGQFESVVKKPVKTARAEARGTKTGANGRTCQEVVAISFPPQCRGVAVCGELV